jgi:hypothetical protein
MGFGAVAVDTSLGVRRDTTITSRIGAILTALKLGASALPVSRPQAETQALAC